LARKLLKVIFVLQSHLRWKELANRLMSNRVLNHSTATPPLRRLNSALETFSQWATAWTGSSWAFAVAVAVIVVWAVTGPIFGFSDTWQLVINTGTTIITFLMVFLIQRAQNKDALAIQIKLNELLASQQGASNRLINLEDWSEEEIVALHERFAKLSDHLEKAADDCESHSIVEAKEAAGEVEEALKEAEQVVDKARTDRDYVRSSTTAPHRPS
jgi:low affinity Fe/Cu permease